MKINEDLATIENAGIIKIANHLLSLATSDRIVEKKLDKPNKSLEKMWEYITGEARKKAVDGCSCIEDEEVYGWAIHYYDEDSLDVEIEKLMNAKKELLERQTNLEQQENESPKTKRDIVFEKLENNEELNMDEVNLLYKYKPKEDQKKVEEQMSLFDFL